MSARVHSPSRPSRVVLLTVLATGLGLVLWASAAAACCRTTSTCVPPPEACGYTGACAVGFASGAVLSDLTLRDFGSCVQVRPLEVASGTLACQADLVLSLDGGTTWASYTAIPATARMTFTYLSSAQGDPCSWPPLPRSSTTYTGTLDQLDISGGGLPQDLMIRESVVQVSTGPTSVPTGGAWATASSFEVNLEMSLDAGASWFPALSTCRIALGPLGATPARTSSWGRLKTIYR